MAKYFKKVGLRMVEAEAGASDLNAVEVRLTRAEYSALIEARNKEAREKAEAIGQKVAALEELQKMGSILEKTKNELKKSEESLQDLVAANDNLFDENLRLENELKNESYLNKNMIRIMKEKNNKERGLPRYDSGYIFIEKNQNLMQVNHLLTDEEYECMPDDYKKVYPDPCFVKRNVLVWRTRLQTCYSADLPLETIRTRVLRDLTDPDDGFLVKRGCVCFSDDPNHFGEYTDFDGECGMFAYIFKAPLRGASPLWEIEIFTNKELYFTCCVDNQEKVIDYEKHNNI